MSNDEILKGCENDIRSRYVDKHIGFKKCRDGLIAILEILGENNENREDIVDKNFAMMQCSRAKVLEILDMHDKNKAFDSACGIYGGSLEYKVGKIVEPNRYSNSNLSEVCTSGIMYFLTEEAAYFYEYIPHDGMYKKWHENGQIQKRCTYKDGELDGLCEEWHTNGQMDLRHTYKNGELDGHVEEWLKNGQMLMHFTYNDNKIDGPCEEWHENGQMKLQCTYKDGEPDGQYEEWHENGQMKLRHTYKNGKLEDLYESWSENGQILIRCTFKNGEICGLKEVWNEDGSVNEKETKEYE